ncbi:MAG: NAD(P)H-dependent oxidoreductase subunit E [Eubacteriales bacterium]|nr:NAD(P)H-dependent oxidoreductase subunit E [Eubacteriales bacterium]
MKKKMSYEKYCKCEDDHQKYGEILNVIDLYRGREGCLIQVLHAAQKIYGHLPLELQKFIADELKIPLSEVTGVVSFYSFFSVTPRGEHTIRVCLGTACYVRGGKKLVEHLIKTLGVDIGGTTDDGKFTFEIARCIGACGLAPAIMIDDVVYKQMTPAKLNTLLAGF